MAQDNHGLSIVLALLPLLFHNNQTVDEIEAIVPQIDGAVRGAKTGAAFAISGVPFPIHGVRGNFAFSWTPDSANPAPAV